jgi:uncharacterized membrane protein
MGCLEILLKGILIVTNVVVMVAGLLLLVVGGIFFTKTFDFYPDLEDYNSNINAILIPMLVLGGILLLVGLVGCLGACTGKAGLLNVYFIVVLIVVVLEVALIILVVVKKDDVKEAALEAAEELCTEYLTLADSESMDDTNKLAVNMAQSLAGCCGYDTGASYWDDAVKPYGRNSSLYLPPGCCSGWNQEDMDDSFVLCSSFTDDDATYEEGCVEKMESTLDSLGVVIIAIVAAIIIFQLICLFAACYSKKNDMVA